MYHASRPDIGYVQGMAYPAAILLLNFDPYKTFKYFCNLIVGNDFILSLFKFKLSNIQLYIRTFDYFLKERHSSIYKHLNKL